MVVLAALIGGLFGGASLPAQATDTTLTLTGFPPVAIEDLAINPALETCHVGLLRTPDMAGRPLELGPITVNPRTGRAFLHEPAMNGWTGLPSRISTLEPRLATPLREACLGELEREREAGHKERLARYRDTFTQQLATLRPPAGPQLAEIRPPAAPKAPPPPKAPSPLGDRSLRVKAESPSKALPAPVPTKGLSAQAQEKETPAKQESLLAAYDPPKPSEETKRHVQKEPPRQHPRDEVIGAPTPAPEHTAPVAPNGREPDQSEALAVFDRALNSGISSVVRNALSLAAAQERLRAAQLSAEASDTSPLTLQGVGQLGGGWQITGNSAQDGMKPRGAAGVELRYNLLDGGHQAALTTAAGVETERRELFLVQEQAKLIGLVRSTFWSWQIDRAERHGLAQWRKPFKAWLSAAHQLFSERLITAEDLLRMEAVDADLETRLDKLELRVAEAEAIWLSLTEEPLPSAAPPLWPAAQALPAFETLLKKVDQTVFSETADLAERQAEAKIAALEAENAAKVDLESRLRSGYPANGEAFLGVRVTVPLWDGGQRDKRLGSAKAEAAAARLEAEAFRDSLRRDVVAIYAALERADQDIRLAASRLSSGDLSFSNAQVRYKVLPRKLLPLVQQFQAWMTTQGQSASATAAYFGAYNRLLEALGESGASLPEA
ncbi:MAG: TolC family protein [Rhodospirillales bacterium]